MGRKKKLHTYEVYMIVQGTKSTILISIDGKQLTIEEAYNLYSVQDAARHRVGKYVRKPEIRGCDRRYYDV